MNHLPSSGEGFSSRLRRFFGAVGRLLAQAAIWGLFSIPVLIVFLIAPEDWGHNESLLAFREGLELMLGIISIGLVMKIIDDESIISLGLQWNRRAVVNFLAGFLITLIVLGAEFIAYIGLGWIKIEGFVWQTQKLSFVFWNFLGTLILFCFVGCSEELLSRGFQLQTIGKGLNRFWGVVLSSILFSYQHRNNPGMTFTGLILILLAGLVFAYAYLQTGQLWLSMGLHAGWDFFVVVVFYGFPIGTLRIFHLMNLAVSFELVRFFTPVSFLALVACFVLTFIYGRFKKRVSVVV